MYSDLKFLPATIYELAGMLCWKYLYINQFPYFEMVI